MDRAALSPALVSWSDHRGWLYREREVLDCVFRCGWPIFKENRSDMSYLVLAFFVLFFLRGLVFVLVSSFLFVVVLFSTYLSSPSRPFCLLLRVPPVRSGVKARLIGSGHTVSECEGIAFRWLSCDLYEAFSGDVVKRAAMCCLLITPLTNEVGVLLNGANFFYPIRCPESIFRKLERLE